MMMMTTTSTKMMMMMEIIIEPLKRINTNRKKKYRLYVQRFEIILNTFLKS